MGAVTVRTGDGAYTAFICFYLLCIAVTWAVYRRPAHRWPGV